MRFRRIRKEEPGISSGIAELLVAHPSCVCCFRINDELWSHASQSPSLLLWQHQTLRNQLSQALRDRGIKKLKAYRFPFLLVPWATVAKVPEKAFSAEMSGEVWILVFEAGESLRRAIMECKVQEVVES